MDNMRLLVWATFSLLLWLTYQAWITQYPAVVGEIPQATADNDAVPSLPIISSPELPLLNDLSAEDTLPITEQGPTQSVRVQTDVLDILIDEKGGDLVRADLPNYPVDKSSNMPVRLLNFEQQDRWVLQTGLRSVAGDNEPNHLAQFSADRNQYSLSEGAEELEVVLDWEDTGPVQARKIYTFRRGQYAVDLNIVLENTGDEIWRGASYGQIVRRHIPVERSFTAVDSYSFTGPVLYDGNEYEKLDIEDLIDEPVSHNALTGGWLAIIQHHFLAAVVPPTVEPFNYQATARGQDYVVTGVSDIIEIPARGSHEFSLKLFVGPKIQEQLAASGPELELTVDYGMLTILAQPLFWLLQKVHSYVGNWGWAIIIVTLMIKLAFYKLTATSGRSMAKMRKLQPRMKALQETYKDNREELSRHMMDLYKREKVNPAAGCLPILIQMPFFFAFYWVLIETVEIRQAPFMFWLSDLSSRDPYFVLPVLMGAAMLLQTRINPAPPDPIQAKVMQIMPVAFSVFFAFFPAGLVLYWLTNTALSILQQWRINKVIAG